MKAVQIDAFGGPEVLQVRDIPDPMPGPGDVLIDIHAASVNPADWKTRNGSYVGPVEGFFPHTLGRDFSGVVRELGDSAEGLQIGDEVYGVTLQGADGAYAEAIAIGADLVGLKPASINHDQAAALALTTLTAMIALEDTAQLVEGQKLLVQGGAGGVGSVGIQIGHFLGAHVITTASPENHDYVSGLGADEVIDYNTTDFTQAVSDCDVVFDTVGGKVHAQSYSVLKSNGKLVWIGGQPEGFSNPRQDVNAMRPDVQRARHYMDRISALITSGAVKTPEMHFMGLDDIRVAHELSATGHVRGKIVLQVR